MSTSFASSSFDISSIDSSQLKIQIIAYDSYQCLPSSLDKTQFSLNGICDKTTTTFPHVPIIRVFGKLPTGHTCLLHIHNVFPYIYIPFTGSSPKNTDDLNKQLIRFKDEIEWRLSSSYRRDDTEAAEKGQNRQNRPPTASSGCFLADLSIVKGVPFYNYAVGFTPFIKISLLSSRYVARLSRLLSDGVIFSRKIQPFESHIPYTFQFLLDYNCYSCSWLSLSKFYWRYPLIQLKNREDYQTYFDTDFCRFNKAKINGDLIKFISAYMNTLVRPNYVNVLDPEEFPRMGRSLLELDTSASWIINRNELQERVIHDRLIETPSSLTAEKYINSTRALLSDVKFQRRQRNLPNDPKLKLFDNTQERAFSGEKWVEIDELKDLLQYCSKLSEDSFYGHHGRDKKLDAESVVSQYPWLYDYPTSFKSVDKLQYEPNTLTLDLMKASSSLTAANFLSQDGFVGSRPSQPFQLSQLGENILDSVIVDDLEGDPEGDPEDPADPEDPEDPEASHTHMDAEEGKDISINDMNTSLYQALEEDKLVDAEDTDLHIFEETQTQKGHIDSSFHQMLPPFSQISIGPSQGFNIYSLFNDMEHQENLFVPKTEAPRYNTNDDFMNSFDNDYGMLKINYTGPFFSKRDNYDSTPFYFAGKKFQLDCLDIQGLPPYESVGTITSNEVSFDTRYNIQSIWSYSKHPPQYKDIEHWCLNKSSDVKSQLLDSEIEPVTQKLQAYKYSSAETPVERKNTNYSKLVMLTIEIHVNTRENLEPDPDKDSVAAIFWHFDRDNSLNPLNIEDLGVFVVDDTTNIAWDHLIGIPVSSFEDEESMIAGLVGLVELVDPDILGGYEIHSSSWGYIIERFKKVYDVDLPVRFSRVACKHNNKAADSWGYRHASGIRITGRHMLNFWRTLRGELRLGNYSLENAVFQVLHRRIPHFSPKVLTKWYCDDKKGLLSCALSYYVERLRLEVRLVEQLEIIEKVIEQSRLLGIDFNSIIYRGSQFKVESLLVRLAKAEDYILVSPSRKQVFNQDPLQCIPLILEPESALYKSPLVVLDFQSLYPSVLIAYNYCFSTLLGRLRGFNPKRNQKLGVITQKLPEGLLKCLQESVTLSPNGLMFTKPSVRKSLMAKMLTEILDARILVKDTMRQLRDDRELNKLYNNRQLALKMIANVTYGYASATFSGRMPHSALADAIVSSGRETLLRAISEIEGNPKWGAKVVYGDTDSLFIYLPGKTRKDAFKLGKEMAAHITDINPAPIKLKFEKVYHPCILVSKKRYIGWKYEYEEQETPDFDAKGIETVRRDGIPAQQKIVEKAINILFETMDVSKVKSYVLDQFTKIIRNKVNLKDFLFAKEVRVGTYKNEAYIPPGARVSMEKMAKDHRAEPQYKERVFYVVKKGNNDQPLRERCMSPSDFLNDETAELDTEYYINKVLIPPLERIFNLAGIDVRRWYNEMPKYISYGDVELRNLNVRTTSCICCNDPVNRTNDLLCDQCNKNKAQTMLELKSRLKFQESHLRDICTICDACTRRTVNSNSIRPSEYLACDSKDCSVFFDRQKAFRQVHSSRNQFSQLPDW
ncbi:hypothetical protein FOA43_003019 [Brettanomyces nanus]|uniref:DNA polymerase n=1 Tax=Eeniella nana TaxID=13502 RepID=A0A875S1Q2_EENNA|nr:uncharacterized protein FOA43_003019 [Brettanomyces nanus]QPG75661.1 hypothetical protein FOA43_003019 [Brettanomyces nanus]